MRTSTWILVVTLHETLPKIHGCRRCFKITLRCWAEGFDTIVDPIALTLHGQIHARETGLDLYEIVLGRTPRKGGHAYLVTRDAARISTGKPHIALAEHRCEKTFTEYVAEESQGVLDDWLYPATPKTIAEDLVPPF